MQCVVALALLLANLLFAGSRRVNYCGAKMCGHTNSHTFCRYPPGASPTCVGYAAAPLSSDEKVRILARLNRRRSEAASGRLGNMPTAGDMLKLRWVDELAREAQRWADQCRPPHSPEERDDCRDLFSISVGQCVASVVGEAPGLKVETMVDLWHMQSMLYKGNVTVYVVPVSGVNYFGDFAQMVWASSYMVGCARSRFMTVWNGRPRSVERLVCNIAPRGPLPGRPLWTPAPPASACPPRSTQDPQLPTLCSFQADIDVSVDVNGVMTIEEHILLTTVLEIETNDSLNYLGSLDEIYLTKTAIVTIEDTVTEAIFYYNPMQKRDVLDRHATNGSLNETYIHNNEVLNETTTIKYKLEKIDFITKKIKIIGRPKTYDIEDLSDDICSNCITTEQTNHVDQLARDIIKVDRELYVDFSEVSEEMESFVTSTEKAVELYTENTTRNHEEINQTVKFTSPNDLEASENLTIPIGEQSVSEKELMINSNMSVIVNCSVAADDDYLSDPETVKEIQEALERMENSLVDLSKATGKARRDASDANHNTTSRDSDSSQPTSDYSGQNAASEKGPMLSMVLKYLPYLKPYENEILGNIARSDANIGYSSSFVGNIELLLFVCYYY